ncbi:MAG: DinB family protein, partial [Chloroflexi bacterium]
MEDQLTKIRRSSIYLMNKTVRMLGNVLQNVSQEQAATLRDGDDGWTVLEVVCHLRDYSNIFYERAQMMLNDEYPDLPAYDHEALAVERAYNQQDLREVYADMNRQRKQIVRFFLKLTDAQWQCAGT